MHALWSEIIIDSNNTVSSLVVLFALIAYLSRTFIVGRCSGANIQVTYSLTVAGKKGNLPMMMMMMRLLIMVASCGCRCWRGVRERVQECMQICKIYYERPYLMVLFIADVDAQLHAPPSYGQICCW